MLQTVGIIGKVSDSRFGATLGQLVQLLRQRQLSLLIDDSAREHALPLGVPTVSQEQLGKSSELVIVIGGDGTFLTAARTLVQHQVPLVGVHLGRVGFLADIFPDEIATHMNAVLDGHYYEESRFLMDVKVNREGQTVWHTTALNEVVAHTRHIARLIEFVTRVDQQQICEQRADGVIIATPTGSTAYALSAGGPIMHPSLDALVMVPISPHTLASRPLVLPGDSLIEIQLIKSDEGQAQITCDGQVTNILRTGDSIHIRKLDTRIRLIHPHNYNYFRTLRTKLHWGYGL